MSKLEKTKNEVKTINEDDTKNEESLRNERPQQGRGNSWSNYELLIDWTLWPGRGRFRNYRDRGPIDA